ncbi:hypothetical protein [Actinokineospora sp. HUAS TT18]|uniref:hypothetical protein n=1 Tax=Actinokineospora sp. HUAS TT18 TaxID=3447451 RepID=UPI003F521095
MVSFVRLCTVALGLVLPISLGAPAAPAAQADGQQAVLVDAEIGGKSIRGRVVDLDPERRVRISLHVKNDSVQSLDVSRIRISGSVLGMTFYSYDVDFAFTVSPGESASRTMEIDIRDLVDQAVGLMYARVELLTDDRNALGEVETVVDVHGSPWSILGIFAIALLVLTTLLWVNVLLTLAGNRLPSNRFRRALRFVPAGFGTGLVAVVSLAMLRIAAPVGVVEVPLAIGCCLVVFVAGFLTPSPPE